MLIENIAQSLEVPRILHAKVLYSSLLTLNVPSPHDLQQPHACSLHQHVARRCWFDSHPVLRWYFLGGLHLYYFSLHPVNTYTQHTEKGSNEGTMLERHGVNQTSSHVSFHLIMMECNTHVIHPTMHTKIQY